MSTYFLDHNKDASKSTVEEYVKLGIIYFVTLFSVSWKERSF